MRMCFLIEPKSYSVPYAESASLTRHSKMDGSSQDGRNGKSRTRSKTTSNVAIVPLFTLSLRRPGFFRFYIPRSECRLKISLNMKADRVLYSPHSRLFLSGTGDQGLGKWISGRLRRVMRISCLRSRTCKMTRCAYAALGTQLVSTGL